ncbi:ribonucleotide-diphosphate reductase subunit alpha, partial [Francisella tularensis subsp. holarctica]|nr:ribonucleotide-diphosphate reductase subunit alpha [Francisella tularensis subsp. holarctica]
PFMHPGDADMVANRQGNTRKGSYDAYMDISHPDIIEILGIRVPTGDVNRKSLKLHHAVTQTAEFMQAVPNDQDWKLIDP